MSLPINTMYNLHIARRHPTATHYGHTLLAVWLVVSGVRRMNEVNTRRHLVWGWVTIFGRVYHLGM